MRSSLETLGFSIDGHKSHAEVYTLLSEAKVLYLEALSHTTGNISGPKDLKTPAGQAVFKATLDALTHYKKEGALPLLAVLPPPILVAMAYLLDQDTYISLSQLEVTTGHPDYDNTIIPWSNTLLWSLPAKQRFFYELLEMYSGLSSTRKPLLSQGRVRAAQLLALGNYLISREIKKIGQPPLTQIFLPTSDST